MAKKAYIFSSGCIRRALDMTKIHTYLERNGWELTDKVSVADVIIISTCGAVDKTERLSLAAVKDITVKRSPFAKVIITGCLPKIDPERLQEIGDFIFVPTRSLEKFDEVLCSKIKFEDVPDANMLTDQSGILDYILAYRMFRNSLFLKLFRGLSTNKSFLKFSVMLSHTINSIKNKLGMTARKKIVPYYNIRIAEGCMGTCAYCAIRFSTGELKSKPEETIIEEFKAGLQAGHKIFQLVSEDTGCYGIDIESSMPKLLRKILAIEGDYKLVLIDFNPQWVVKYYDELVSIFHEYPGMIQEMFSSLQSGSNRILKEMRRPYVIEDVKEKLISLKREIPDLILRTTVIIGFPGETEEDFEGTKQAVQEIGFAEVELNKYEDRPGTDSSNSPDKVSQETIERRFNELRKVP